MLKCLRTIWAIFRTMLETVARRSSVKKMLLQMSQNSQENACARVSFFIKLQAFVKKRLWHRYFSCEFCKIPKNTFSNRTPPVAASGLSFLKVYKKVLGKMLFSFWLTERFAFPLTAKSPELNARMVCVHEESK